VPPLSVGVVTEYQTALSIWVNHSGEGQLRTAPIRCDNISYIKYMGCIVPSDKPEFILSRSPSAGVPESADHIAYAQRHLSGSPGSRSMGYPLTRHYWGSKANLNRRAALRQCRAQFGSWTGQDCDEYSFSSTNQGCSFRSCHVDIINSSDNRRSGGMLGAFFASKRIMNGDAFWVGIVP